MYGDVRQHHCPYAMVGDDQFREKDERYHAFRVEKHHSFATKTIPRGPTNSFVGGIGIYLKIL